jgi:hypothetical protein
MTTENKNRYAATIKEFFASKQRSALESKLDPLERDWGIVRGDFDKAGALRPPEQRLQHRRQFPTSTKTEMDFVREQRDEMDRLKPRLVELCNKACEIRNAAAAELSATIASEAAKVEAQEQTMFGKYKVAYQPSALVTALRQIAAELAQPVKMNSTETSPKAVAADFLA